jgi:hypothetical protein
MGTILDSMMFIQKSKIQEVKQFMLKQIGAALIVSAVLFNTASPVFAKSVIFHGKSEVFFGKIFPEDGACEIGGIRLKSENQILTGEQKKELDAFIGTVTTGDANRITGLFVPDYGGFFVIQQPISQDGIVSPMEDVLTQFHRPAANGVIGLLAHNFAAGKWFDQFSIGSLLFVIYGDGRNDQYQLKESLRFQALDGTSSTTDFVDLTTGAVRSVDQVYDQVYAGKPHLTLQTCIKQTDDLDWGRLFLLAEPIE